MKNKILNLESKDFTSKDIAECTGKEHKHVMRDIRNEIKRLNDGGMQGFVESNFGLMENTELKGVVSNTYFKLTRIGVQQLAMRYDAVIRAKVNMMLEKLKEHTIPKTYGEALIAAGKLQIENDKLAAEKAEAIRTKAHISDRKTATALATASNLSRKVNKLSKENEVKNIESKLLAQEILLNKPRDIMNKIIRLIAQNAFEDDYRITFNKYYELLYDKKHINVNARRNNYQKKNKGKSKTKIDMIKDKEWLGAVSLAVAWAKQLNVDIK